MGIRDRALAGMSRQLGHPRGLPGRAVGRLLNRRNNRVISGAVDRLPEASGMVLADLGFGGGAGLELLIQRAGPRGRVHGVDVSTVMLAAATRRFRHELTSGKLDLHEAPIERLPFPDEHLDGAITLNTVYFMPDLAAAFTEIARTLTMTGRVVVGLGDPDAMARMPVTANGFRLRPVSDVLEVMTAAGLVLHEHTRIGNGPSAYHLLVAARNSRSS